MRLRQPVTVVALVALGLHALLLVLQLRERSLPEGWELGSLASAIIDPLLLVLLTAAVVTCWLGAPTRAARGLTLAASVVTALLSAAVLGLAVAAVVAMPWPSEFGGPALEVDFYRWLLPPLTVAAISLAVQIALLGRPAAQSAPDPETAPIRSELGSEPEGEPAPDPELQPTWTTDQAVGTVWRRAGEASPQTAATDWDAAGETGGWWSSGPDREPAQEPGTRTES